MSIAAFKWTRIGASEKYIHVQYHLTVVEVCKIWRFFFLNPTQFARYEKSYFWVRQILHTETEKNTWKYLGNISSKVASDQGWALQGFGDLTRGTQARLPSMDLCLRDCLIRVTDTPQITIWEQLTNKLTQPNNQKSVKVLIVVLIFYFAKKIFSLISISIDIRFRKIFKLFWLRILV